MRHLGQERSVPPDTSGSASPALARHPGSPVRPKRRSPTPLRKRLIRVELSHRDLLNLRPRRLLAVLGSSPARRTQTLRVNPEPRFMVFSFDADKREDTAGGHRRAAPVPLAVALRGRTLEREDGISVWGGRPMRSRTLRPTWLDEPGPIGCGCRPRQKSASEGKVAEVAVGILTVSSTGASERSRRHTQHFPGHPTATCRAFVGRRILLQLRPGLSCCSRPPGARPGGVGVRGAPPGRRRGPARPCRCSSSAIAVGGTHFVVAGTTIPSACTGELRGLARPTAQERWC
jgi:hypothetical protein